jgi:outer membrane protein, heavy metal efflux system
MGTGVRRSALALAFGMAVSVPHAAAPAAAQAPPVVTEADVVAAVRAGSAAVAAARAGAGADAQGPAQVRWPFPMVEAMPMIGAISDGEPAVQLMARQPIPWPGRLSAERDARARMAEASVLEADALELELVALARMAYAELWGLQEQAARLQEFGRQLDLYRDAALAQYAAGRGPQQAVLGIQVEGGMLTQRLESLSEQRSAQATRLTALTGGRLRIDAGASLAPPAATTAAADPAGARVGIEGHPMIEAGRALQAAELSMAAMSRTMLRPDFTLGVNLNLSRMAFDRMYGQEPVAPAIGVMLPLWRGGVRARIREAELRAAQRELETADARLQLEAEVDGALAQLTRVRSRIAVYERTLRPLVRQSLDASVAGYQAGTIRFLELLDAQRMALDVEIDLIMARVREAELTARLDAATGRMGG